MHLGQDIADLNELAHRARMLNIRYAHGPEDRRGTASSRASAADQPRSVRDGYGGGPRYTVFHSVKNSRAALPCSREPLEDSFMPPKGSCSSRPAVSWL